MNQSDQKKDYPGIKTHEEILDLFKEVESIEGKLKSPELIEDIYTESETVKKEAGSTKTTGELPAEPQSSEIPTEFELKDKIKAEKKKGKKHKISFPYKIRRSKKPKAPKAKRFLRFLKIKPGETEISEPTELQDQLEEPKGEIKPIKSTFTLRIDDKGHLVGFNIKKSKPKKEKKSRRILPFKRKKGEAGASAEPAAEKPEVKGIKGKIIGIVSKIKPKKSGGGEGGKSGSKISGIVDKIKGIFSRKSK